MSDGVVKDTDPLKTKDRAKEIIGWRGRGEPEGSFYATWLRAHGCTPSDDGQWLLPDGRVIEILDKPGGFMDNAAVVCFVHTFWEGPKVVHKIY